MMASSEPQQLPSLLAPLRQALARIDALAQPVKPREVELSVAAGRVLAADVAVAASLPLTAVALRDGWAVQSDRVADAGPYAPQPLAPAPVFVETGAPPADADAVLAPDAVTLRGGMAEATASVVPGQGALAAGADAFAIASIFPFLRRRKAMRLACVRESGSRRPI
jgi:molybdopterin molybdotransferase